MLTEGRIYSFAFSRCYFHWRTLGWGRCVYQIVYPGKGRAPVVVKPGRRAAK